MARKYKNPPVVEAVCEFRISPKVSWDLTFPGLFYETVKDRFPDREQQRSIPPIAIELIQSSTTEGGAKVEQRISSSNDWIVFYSETRKSFIQVGSHLVSIHYLKPYPSWDVFFPSIEFVFNGLEKVIKGVQLDRIGLRYVNKIEIQKENVDLKEYFQFRPFFGDNLSKEKEMKTFITGCELPFKDSLEMCRLQLTSSKSKVPGTSSFTLDLDYYSVSDRAYSDNGPLEWVKLAHTNLEEVFEGCLTDNLRSLFGEN